MFCSVGIQALGCCVAVQRALSLPAWRRLMILNNYEARLIIDAIAVLNNCERFALLVFLNRMRQSFKTCLLLLECLCFMVSYANFSFTHAYIQAGMHARTHTYMFCHFSISLIPADTPFSNANGSVCVSRRCEHLCGMSAWFVCLCIRVCVRACVCVCVCVCVLACI